MKIEVFKCPHTGKFFEAEEDFIAHLSEHEKETKEQNKLNEIRQQREELIKQPRLTSNTIEEYRQKAIDVINIINEDKSNSLLLLEFSNLYFGDISNSHSSPVGFPQNWGRKEGLPTSYKGWGGNITLVLAKDCDLSGGIRSAIDRLEGFHTHSGGYRGTEYKEVKGYVLSYGLSIFLEDFPLIKEKHNQYTELVKKRSLHWEETYSIIEEANSKNELLISCDKAIKEYQNQINELIAKKNLINLDKNNILKSISDKIKQERPFIEEEKYIDLFAIFN